MSAAYAEWIQDYVASKNGAVLGRCKEAVTAMRETFPELRIAKGHVFVMGWGERGHWWLIAPDGTIVDPTKSQFPLIFEYEEWKPGTPVRVGKCMNCGDDIWEPVDTLDKEPPRRSSCSKECESDLMREFG